MLPNVDITLGNGALGSSQATSDGVVGMILTGVAVADTFELDKAYVLGSVRDLVALGITEANNFLIYKDVSAFYQQAGDGAELWLYAVDADTPFDEMAINEPGSAVVKLLDAADGRIKLLGLNKLPGEAYEPDLTQQIDKDSIDAAAVLQLTLESYEAKIMPVRSLISAAYFTGEVVGLYKPAEGSYNRVGFVLASDDSTNRTAAIGQLLGRAAVVEPQISLARVSDGSLATEGYNTSGKSVEESLSVINVLHDSGYMIYRTFPTRNGVYLNDDRMAAPMSDDYSHLNNGRIIDKALAIIYSTYLDSVKDNIDVGSDGKLSQAVCSNFESIVENAVSSQMADQISNFDAYVDPAQNVLADRKLKIVWSLTPQATLDAITGELGFVNPSS